MVIDKTKLVSLINKKSDESWEKSRSERPAKDPHPYGAIQPDDRNDPKPMGIAEIEEGSGGWHPSASRPERNRYNGYVLRRAAVNGQGQESIRAYDPCKEIHHSTNREWGG